MNRQLLAAYLGLFIGLAEIFMWKEFEAPALLSEYHPSVRKKARHAKLAISCPQSCQVVRLSAFLASSAPLRTSA